MRKRVASSCEIEPLFSKEFIWLKYASISSGVGLIAANTFSKSLILGRLLLILKSLSHAITHKSSSVIASGKPTSTSCSSKNFFVAETKTVFLVMNTALHFSMYLSVFPSLTRLIAFIAWISSGNVVRLYLGRIDSTPAFIASSFNKPAILLSEPLLSSIEFGSTGTMPSALSLSAKTLCSDSTCEYEYSFSSKCSSVIEDVPLLPCTLLIL